MLLLIAKISLKIILGILVRRGGFRYLSYMGVVVFRFAGSSTASFDGFFGVVVQIGPVTSESFTFMKLTRMLVSINRNGIRTPALIRDLYGSRLKSKMGVVVQIG